MNVAYLLVGTAWLSGQAPDAKDIKTMTPTPAVIHSAPAIGGGCGCDGGYDTGCCDSGSSWGHRFKERMRGLFRRGGHGSDCCDTCAPAPTCCSAPAPTCCSAPVQSSCDSCCDSGSSWGSRFREKLRGLFRRGHGDCCDTGCNTGCNSCGGGPVGYAPGGTGIPPAKGGELIPLPKDGTPLQKLPNDKGNDKGTEGPAGGGTKGVQINVVPNAPVPAVAPVLENAPTITPAPTPDVIDNKQERTPF